MISSETYLKVNLNWIILIYIPVRLRTNSIRSYVRIIDVIYSNYWEVIFVIL